MLTDVLDAYAKGEVYRDDLMEILIGWRYEATMRTDGYDDLLFTVSGSFDDVVRALDEQIIDADLYELVLDVGPERIAVARERVDEMPASKVTAWAMQNRAEWAGALARPGALAHHEFCRTRKGERCTCWQPVARQVG